MLPISIILYILHTASLRGFYNNSEKKIQFIFTVCVLDHSQEEVPQVSTFSDVLHKTRLCEKKKKYTLAKIL